MLTVISSEVNERATVMRLLRVWRIFGFTPHAITKLRRHEEDNEDKLSSASCASFVIGRVFSLITHVDKLRSNSNRGSKQE